MSEKKSAPESQKPSAQNVTEGVPAKIPSGAIKASVDTKVSRLPQSLASTSLEQKEESESEQRKPKARERIRIFVERELEKIRKKMPTNVYQRHETEIKKLVDNFGEDVAKIENAVKSQVHTIEKELLEKTGIRKIVDGLKLGKKSKEIIPLLHKVEDLSDSDLKTFERALVNDPEKRAVFLACAVDLKDEKGLGIKRTEKIDKLFGILSTVRVDGIDKSVSGGSAEEMKESFKKDKEKGEVRTVLTNKINEIQSTTGSKIQSLKDILKTRDIDAFFAKHKAIKVSLTESISQYRELEVEAKRTGDVATLEKIRVAIGALQGFIELDSDKYFSAKAIASRFLISKKEENTLKELATKCDVAITGLSGKISVVSYMDEENTIQTAKEIEESIKAGGIEKISSSGFAQYLIQLSSAGKLTLSYLSKTIGTDALKKFGYLWKIGETNGKVDTNAQKYLKENKKESVKNEFESVLTKVFELEKDRFKLGKAKSYENTKKILLTEGNFKERKAEEILAMLKEEKNLNPLDTLSTIIANSRKNISDKEMYTLIEKIAVGISQDCENTVKKSGDILKMEAEIRLPPESKWKNVVSFIQKKNTSSTEKIQWRDLMSEAKTGTADRIVKSEDNWFLNSSYDYHEMLTDKKQIEALRTVLEKYKGKGVLKPEYEKILVDFLGALSTKEAGKEMKEVSESPAKIAAVAESAKAVKKVVEVAKQSGKEISVAETLKTAKKVNTEIGLEEKIEKIDAQEKTKKAIESSLEEFTKAIEAVLTADGSELARELLAILKKSPEDFTNKVLFNDGYRLYILNITSSIKNNPAVDTMRAQLVKMQTKKLRVLSQDELQTYTVRYTQYDIKDWNSKDGDTDFGRQAGKTITSSDTSSFIRSSEPIYYTSGGNLREYLDSGSTVSIGGSAIEKSENGNLIIHTGSKKTEIAKKYATAALVTIEVANSIGFPELLQNLDNVLSEMKYDPLFERILDGASEYEELLVAKKLASTLGLKYDEGAQIPEQIYTSIKNNLTLLPGSPSVQFIATKNGILGNNGQIRTGIFLQYLRQSNVPQSA